MNATAGKVPCDNWTCATVCQRTEKLERTPNNP